MYVTAGVLTVIGITILIKGVLVHREQINFQREIGSITNGRMQEIRSRKRGKRKYEQYINSVIYYANNPHQLKQNEFRFRYVKKADTWRAYILLMPSLRGRDSDLHKTHRIRGVEGGNSVYWVCWDRNVNTLKDMQNISKAWADSLMEYIATGKLFT